MTCTGIIQGGQVVVEGDVQLPEGLRVRIIPDELPAVERQAPLLTLGDWLQQADQVRAALPRTGDSTELLRQLREDRAGQ